MRLIPLALAALLLLIQYPLWLGKGGWLHVKDMEAQVAAVHQKNDGLRARNAKLDSEVRDLKDGTEAVEERARVELGMIKQNEVFVQVVGPAANAPAGQPGVSPTAGAPATAPAPVAPTAPAAAATTAPARGAAASPAAGATHR